MACKTIMALRTEAAVISSPGLGAPEMAISAARLPLASAMRRRSAVRGGRRGAHGQRQTQRFDDAGHGAGRAHDHAGADRRGEAAADQLDLGNVDGAGAMLRPEPAAICAGAQHFTPVMAHHHRTCGQHEGG